MQKNKTSDVMDKTLEKIKDKKVYKINEKDIFKINSCPICKKKKLKKISKVEVYNLTLNQTVTCLYLLISLGFLLSICFQHFSNHLFFGDICLKILAQYKQVTV